MLPVLTAASVQWSTVLLNAEQLKSSYFRLQQRYVSSRTELEATRLEADKLRSRLAAAEMALSAQQASKA